MTLIYDRTQLSSTSDSISVTTPSATDTITTYTTVVAEIAATSYGFAGCFTAAPIIVRF